MNEQNSYETLGLTESSSFEDIQEARDRLIEECAGDRKRAEAIEAAYDAILMERLRLRQEGKIKVPDRIRFAESAAEPLPSKPAIPAPARPEWLTQLVDTPDRNEVLWPGLTFSVLCLLGLYAPSLALALGVGATIYFLNRKEHKFWRSVLLTVAGLAVGFAVGLSLAQGLMASGLQWAWATPDVVTALITFIALWLLSSFFR